MKQYQTFIFDSYSFDPKTGTIELRYSLDGEVKFVEKILIPASTLMRTQHDTGSLDRALFALHLVGGISYFKTCCPKKIEVRSGKLAEEQARFWNTVYENGLGQFFFENQIDFRGLIQFPVSSKIPVALENEKRETRNEKRRLLVPIGGGKDSTVSIELLKQTGAKLTLFRVGRHPLIERCAEVAGLPLFRIERRLDAQLFRLNAEGALNGHVPITAYLSFLTTVVSILNGFDAVIWSNERSASMGNVSYLGKEINHQWSKGIEFERQFQAYVNTYVSPDIASWSLLRPLSELRIAEIFSHFPQYFPVTTSCNTNWKITREDFPLSLRERARVRGDALWCRKCPKCAFVFAIFAPFIEMKTLEDMFGGNLFRDSSLLPLYRQLLGMEGMKPFECIGTPEETQAAFFLAYGRGGYDDTPAMQMFLEKVLPQIIDPKALVQDVLTPSREDCTPSEFRQLFSQVGCS